MFGLEREAGGGGADTTGGGDASAHARAPWDRVDTVALSYILVLGDCKGDRSYIGGSKGDVIGEDGQEDMDVGDEMVTGGKPEGPGLQDKASTGEADPSSCESTGDSSALLRFLKANNYTTMTELARIILLKLT